MSLGKRVGKLERTMGVTGPCQACDGEGLGRFVTVINGIEQVPVKGIGCPGCGRDRIWRYYVIDFPPDEFENGRFMLQFLGHCRDPTDADPPGTYNRSNDAVPTGAA